MERLQGRFPVSGEVAWIGLRRERRAPLTPVLVTRALVGQGLEGDHYRSARAGKRQVTLFQMEHLEVIAALLRRGDVEPGLLRRNIGVRGINLLALRNRRIRIGDVLLEVTDPCHPCSRMEQVFGAGGYNAVRGHGGMCARVLAGGLIQVGDPVAPVS
jgi:MOSC domain-containing protein YiiM